MAPVRETLLGHQVTRRSDGPRGDFCITHCAQREPAAYYPKQPTKQYKANRFLIKPCMCQHTPLGGETAAGEHAAYPALGGAFGNEALPRRRSWPEAA